jgi:hypothetical protein
VLFDANGAQAFGALGGKDNDAAFFGPSRRLSRRRRPGGEGVEPFFSLERDEAMDLGLKDKLAFVSGSTAGIGFAIATALTGEGARVVVNGRTQPAVDAAIAEIRSRTGADAHGFAGDLSLASTATALFRAHPDVEIL